MRALRTALLLSGAVVFALLPLYGDSVPSAAVSHAEWARMLLRGLDLLSEAPGVNDTAAQAFAILSGRDSRAFRADQYVRATGVEAVRDGATRRIRADGGVGEAVYSMAVARSGEYRLRLMLAGSAAAETEISRSGDHAVFQRFSVPSTPAPTWVDAGSVHLDAGTYDATVLLPDGGALDFVEIAPPCVQPIEPQGGWRSAAVTTTEDVGVTALQALDLESELPPADTAIRLLGRDLQLEEGGAVETMGDGFRASARGARVLLAVDLPETGLYTLAVFGVAQGGQRWTTDGCRTTIVCPSADLTPRWLTVLSGVFQKGPHVFAATLGTNTLVERLTLERKKDAPADYAATLARLGLELGPAGPISRERAEEARRFVQRRRAEMARELCGDILRAGTLVAELASASGSSGGGGAGEGGGNVSGPGGGSGIGAGTGAGPGPPPVIPALPPPSPVLPVGFGG